VVATRYSFKQKPGDPNAGGNHRKNMEQAVEGSGWSPFVALQVEYNFLGDPAIRERRHGGTWDKIDRHRPAH
jgi:hypothetical protein